MPLSEADVNAVLSKPVDPNAGKDFIATCSVMGIRRSRRIEHIAPVGDNPHDACAHANVCDRARQFVFSGPRRWTDTHACEDAHAATAPVGRFAADRFGLYDMIGNVWEWTEDCWNETYAGAPNDGGAWLTGDCARRVGRGASWNNNPRNARSAKRNRDTAGNRNDNNGFRLASTPAIA